MQTAPTRPHVAAALVAGLCRRPLRRACGWPGASGPIARSLRCRGAKAGHSLLRRACAVSGAGRGALPCLHGPVALTSPIAGDGPRRVRHRVTPCPTVATRPGRDRHCAAGRCPGVGGRVGPAGGRSRDARAGEHRAGSGCRDRGDGRGRSDRPRRAAEGPRRDHQPLQPRLRDVRPARDGRNRRPHAAAAVRAAGRRAAEGRWPEGDASRFGGFGEPLAHPEWHAPRARSPEPRTCAWNCSPTACCWTPGCRGARGSRRSARSRCPWTGATTRPTRECAGCRPDAARSAVHHLLRGPSPHATTDGDRCRGGRHPQHGRQPAGLAGLGIRPESSISSRSATSCPTPRRWLARSCGSAPGGHPSSATSPGARSVAVGRFDMEDATRPLAAALAGRGLTLPVSRASTRASWRNRCRFAHEGMCAVSWDGRVTPCLSLLHSHDGVHQQPGAAGRRARRRAHRSTQPLTASGAIQRFGPSASGCGLSTSRRASTAAGVR